MYVLVRVYLLNKTYIFILFVLFFNEINCNILAVFRFAMYYILH